METATKEGTSCHLWRTQKHFERKWKWFPARELRAWKLGHCQVFITGRSKLQLSIVTQDLNRTQEFAKARCATTLAGDRSMKRTCWSTLEETARRRVTSTTLVPTATILWSTRSPLFSTYLGIGWQCPSCSEHKGDKISWIKETHQPPDTAPDTYPDCNSGRCCIVICGVSSTLESTCFALQKPHSFLIVKEPTA